jgi:HlyD family secretion protein
MLTRPVLCGLVLLLAACRDQPLPNPSGTLEATVVDVAALLPGRALLVGPQEGQSVARGDTLAVIDTEVMALQRAEAASRRLGLVAQAQAVRVEREQLRRRRALAETTWVRLGELQRQGTATRQQLDNASSERDVAGLAVEAADARLAALDAEGQHLDAVLAVFDRQLRDGVLLAPVGGVVLTRALEPGEVAVAGHPAFRLADLGTLDLKVYLEAGDLDRVRLGEPLPVLVDALTGQRLEGRVSWISDEAEFTPKNAQTRQARAQLVYAVKVRLANPEGRLHIGMPAEVVLP